MYVLKHLRGNAILEASHNNDTYDHEDLARALISRKVSLTGSFLRADRYPLGPAPLLIAVLVLSPWISTPVTAGDGDADDAYRAALRQEATGDTVAARLAYEQVLTIDPEHRAARRALGFEAVDGYWLRGDELQRAKGRVTGSLFMARKGRLWSVAIRQRLCNTVCW